FAYGVITVVAIPLLAHTLGRFVDRRTRRLPVVGAALIFAMFAALLGSMLALPMSLDGAFGWLPWLSYVAVPALAAFVARVLLDRAIASRRARIVAFVAGGLALAPGLALGVWALLLGLDVVDAALLR